MRRGLKYNTFQPEETKPVSKQELNRQNYQEIQQAIRKDKDKIMPSLNDFMARDPLRAAIWGGSGSGKTTLAALLANYEQFRPIYFFDWDRRMGALRASIPQDLWQYIFADSYSDKQQQGSAFSMMEAKLVSIEKEGYKTIILDSMTFMLEGIMARVMMLDGNKNSATMNPQLQNYLSQQSAVKAVLQRMCSANYNFICTFHEGTDKDEVSGRIFKAFNVTGKLVSTVPGYFNEIWHTEVNQTTQGENEFSVRTRSDYTYMARTTFRSLKSTEKQGDVWPKVIAEISNQQEIAKLPPPHVQVEPQKL